MENGPDLRFDIDSLFEHLAENLDQTIDQEVDWHFSLRSEDLSSLERVAEELEHEFMVHLQESTEQVDEHGVVSLGAPMLTVLRRGVLTADDIKQTAARIQQIANERGLTYEGVECYEAIDEDEMYGWIAPEDAGWRLRHMTDCGLEENAKLPWAFLVDAPDPDSVLRISSALETEGFQEREEYDEPNEEGECGLCIFVDGRNNEFELHECAARISKTVEPFGGTLIGMQFYTREDVSEIFETEDEDLA